MGMTTHIIGIKLSDKKWNAMKKVWDACAEAGINAPDDVAKFFNYEEPNNIGVIIDLKPNKLSTVTHGVSIWNEDQREGFDVRIQDLPKDIDIIRFYNAY